MPTYLSATQPGRRRKSGATAERPCGRQVIGELADRRPGVESTGRGHHVGRPATDQLRLKAGNRPGVDSRSPPRQPCEADGSGSEPLDEALDPCESGTVLAGCHLRGGAGGPLHEIGHTHPMAHQGAYRIPVVADNARLQRRGPEPVARPGIADAGIGRVDGRIHPADQEPHPLADGVGEGAQPNGTKPDLVTGHGDGPVLDGEPRPGDHVHQRIGLPACEEPAPHLVTGLVVALVVAGEHLELERRAHGQYPVEVPQGHGKAHSWHVKVRHPRPAPSDGAPGQRQVLDVALEIERLGHQFAAGLQHDPRGVEGHGREPQVRQVTAGAASEVDAQALRTDQVGELLGFVPTTGSGVCGGPSKTAIVVDIHGGPVHGQPSYGAPGSGLEAVPHAGFGAEVPGTGCIRFELLPDPAHQDPEVLGLRLVLGSPHGMEQLTLRYQPARIPDEDRDDAPLFRSEVNVGPVAGGPLLDEVDGELLEFDRRCLWARNGPSQHGPQPRQQFVHPEWFGHVVVGSDIQSLDLADTLMAGGQDDDRHRAPSPDASDHIDAVDSGKAQVEEDHIGLEMGRPVHPLFTAPGRRHLVATGAEADAQCSQQRGVVVAHQDGGARLASFVAVVGGDRVEGAHDAELARGSGVPVASWLSIGSDRALPPLPGGSPATAGRSGIRTTIVQPPPGVSSMSRSPPTASTNPRATARPSPTPTRLSESPRRWKGWKTASRSWRRIPGPRSITLMSTRPATAPASMRSPFPPAWVSALSIRLATARSRSTGSVCTRGSGVSTSTTTSSPRGPRLSTAAAISSWTSVLWSSTSIDPVCRRFMSSRFSTRLFNRSDSSSIVCSRIRVSSGPKASWSESRLEDAALIDARGVRRSWLTAASSADRSWLARASESASAASAWSLALSRTVANWAAKAARISLSSAVRSGPFRARISRSVKGSTTAASTGRCGGSWPAEATADQDPAAASAVPGCPPTGGRPVSDRSTAAASSRKATINSSRSAGSGFP